MDIKDIQSQAAERIWLFPGEHDGETTLLWCDDPAPGIGMDASEAVEYVRKDVADVRIAELERERDAYRNAEEAQIALRQKMEEERDSLAAQAQAFREKSQELHIRYPLSPWIQQHYESVMNTKPEKVLACRDANKKAEALEDAADEFEVHERARQCLKWKASKLRQQAEAQQ